eukprot:g48124.t1
MLDSSFQSSGGAVWNLPTKESKDSLAEVEEKYKKAMVSNAQLDNEKTNLMYQVDTLRESLLELEEQLAETHRMHEEKTKELDRQKHAYSILQHQFETMKETLKEREEMLAEIKELNQKLTSYTQEISDLQETVEWKDKKIGALERQKEYSDAIRIDRDELREEVAMLKERLKAYGLLTNGEAEPVRKDGNTHTEAAETGPQAATQPQSSSDGPLADSCSLIRIVCYSPSNWAFVKERSCLTNLVEFFYEVTRCVDEGNTFDVTYLDISKAFDKAGRLTVK